MPNNEKKEQEELVGPPPTGSGGLSLFSTLTLIFVTLKLTHLIDWRWGWVLSPLWISLLVRLFLEALVLTVLALEERKKNRK